MSDAIRDLFVGVQIEGFDDELQTASDQLDQIVNDAEEGGAALDELSVEGQLAGESIADGMEEASGSIMNMSQMLEDAGAGMTALSALGTKFMFDGIEAANLLDFNLIKLQAAIGDSLPGVVDTFDSEVTRLRHAVTTGDLAQWTLPVFAMFPDNPEMVSALIEPMNNAILKMGGDASTAQVAWIALSTAVTGSYDILTKASRRLPMPLIAGKEAYDVISKISKEAGPLQNLAWTIEALGLSTTTSLSGISDMFDDNTIRLGTASNAWGDFLEVVGKPLQPIQRWLAGMFQTAIEGASPAGESIGRFTTIMTALAGAISIPTVVLPMLLKLLTGVGVVAAGTTIGALAASFGLVVAAVVAGSLVLEDLWTAFNGGESILMDMVGWLDDFLRPFSDGLVRLFAEQIPNAWNSFTDHFRGFFTVMIPNLLIAVGHAIKEFFTVTVVNFFINAINSMIEYANKLPFVNIGLIPLRQTTAESTAAQQLNLAPSGRVGEFVQQLETVMNVPDFEYQSSSALDDLDLSQFLDGPGVAPVAPSMRLGTSIVLEIAEGAIVVHGADDPEATAEAIRDALGPMILEQVEREIRGSVEEEVR